jgi:hypothetical protein
MMSEGARPGTPAALGGVMDGQVMPTRTLRGPEPSLADLEAARRDTIAQIKRLEALLGRAYVRGKKARRGGLVARNLERRERMKVELAHHKTRLTTVNAAIKAGRRAGNLLMLHGIERPRNARELVATLYRLYTDAVPPVEQDERERTIMRLARDYVATGVVG